MKIVRKKLGIILGLSLFFLFSSAAAWAVDSSKQFNFTIQAGDSTSTLVSVKQGELITVNAFLE
ncbi:MAG: hypothetical protein MJ157_03010, partial [Clostridia bacterium]|nr:hypothetical protein [Clostridia bacterium]